MALKCPCLRWFRTELKSTITENLLADAYVEEQGIFDVEEIQQLKKQLFSSNPGRYSRYHLGTAGISVVVETVRELT